MSGSSLQFAFLNTTTIENLSRKRKVWQLAVHLPNPPWNVSTPYWMVTYDANGQLIENPKEQQQLASPSKTFASLHSKPGENPWDLGPLRNFKSVMGEQHWYDWFLPLKHSPCTNHDRGDCQYETGPVVDRMLREVGLLPGAAPPSPGNSEPSKRRRRRRRHRHRRPATGQSMELEEDQRAEEERRKRDQPSRTFRQDPGLGQGDSTVDNV